MPAIYNRYWGDILRSETRLVQDYFIPKDFTDNIIDANAAIQVNETIASDPREES